MAGRYTCIDSVFIARLADPATLYNAPTRLHKAERCPVTGHSTSPYVRSLNRGHHAPTACGDMQPLGVAKLRLIAMARGRGRAGGFAGGAARVGGQDRPETVLRSLTVVIYR